MLTISNSYHGLISPEIIKRYKQERKASKVYERVLIKNGHKSVISGLKELSLSLTDFYADAYQKQKVLNAVYREAINHFKKINGGEFLDK